MTIKPQVIDHIRRSIDILDIQPISKGYSLDLKYLLIAKSGEKYLIRITESDDVTVLNARKNQFDLIRTLSRYSSLVPNPYNFWISDDTRSGVMILSYVEGEDGEESLQKFCEEVQYSIGYRAGEELKKLHQLAAPSTFPSWYQQKRRKHEWYCSEFTRGFHEPAGVDLEAVYAVIAKYMHLMEDITQTFQHDDYHPANLIIRDGRLNGIIDFNRCDWGDPIHDLYKIGFFTRNISIPFAVGEVDGYFQGLIPSDFWKRYALYCAMNIISDIVWSGRMACQTGDQNEVERSLERIRILISDHDGFSSIIPRWYRHYSLPKSGKETPNNGPLGGPVKKDEEYHGRSDE
jgi:aminoglycoside phosphotransferase (APT) family kinase protein